MVTAAELHAAASPMALQERQAGQGAAGKQAAAAADEL